MLIFKDSALIAIQDTGTGITDELRQAILNGALYESSTGTLNEKGFGIGLKLCKEFIEKNEGKLFIDSKMNEGSTFSFTLPLAPVL